MAAIDQQIREQRVELGYHRVVAPEAGVVGDIPVRVGDRVTNATILTTVDDNQGLEVYLQVPVQQAPSLSVGLPVRLVDDRGAEIVTTAVSFVAPSVDPQTQSVLAKAALDRPGDVPHRSIRAGPRRVALGAGADHSAGVGDPDQRPLLRVRRRGRRGRRHRGPPAADRARAADRQRLRRHQGPVGRATG